MSEAAPITARSIRFRARTLMAFVLSPEPPYMSWLGELDRWLSNSPGFFAGKPVLLDLSAGADLRDGRWLVSELSNRAIRLIGVEGTSVDLGMGYPPNIESGRSREVEPPVAARSASGGDGDAQAATTLIVEHPVRSGQSIVHPEGDVIVMGSVGSGSEILAGGSIHIYGTLRGRAMAGALGHEKARVFCSKNEAELLAVNGFYCTAEDMSPAVRGRAAQSYLQHGALVVTVLE